ncbi:speckle-type POZ protein B [Trichonephila clavipes]|nr:speckle-type POZ protein B [Trichonephila clavipes]
MFGREMKVKWTGSVYIEDFAVGTVRRLLTFMYTDSIGEVRWETAFQLYEATDKYDVVPLKQKCSSILKESLSLTDVCQILISADMHYD